MIDDRRDPAMYGDVSDDYLEHIRQRNPELAAGIKAAMDRRTRRREAKARIADRLGPIALIDQRAMLLCRMRAPWVRGLTSPECGRRRMCFLCGGDLPERRQHWCSQACIDRWTQNHEWSSASFAALRRDRRRCVRCGSTRSPEVNHRRPRNGRGYHQGCHHHLKLLETLCHECHVDETNAQAARRRGAA